MAIKKAKNCFNIKRVIAASIVLSTQALSA